MGYKPVPTKYPGSTLTAQEWNTYIRGNMQQSASVSSTFAYVDPYDDSTGDPFFTVNEYGSPIVMRWETSTFPSGGGSPANYFQEPDRMVAPAAGVYFLRVGTVFALMSNVNPRLRINQYSSNGTLRRYSESHLTFGGVGTSTATGTGGNIATLAWLGLDCSSLFSSAIGDYFTVTASIPNATSAWQVGNIPTVPQLSRFEMRYMGDYEAA